MSNDVENVGYTQVKTKAPRPRGAPGGLRFREAEDGGYIHYYILHRRYSHV